MQQKPAPTPEFQISEIKDVVVREPRKFDDRGRWLRELFRRDELSPRVVSGHGLPLFDPAGRRSRTARARRSSDANK